MEFIVYGLSLLALCGCSKREKPTTEEMLPPETHENIVQTIYVPPEKDRIVSDLYDRFLALVAGGEMGKGTSFPSDERFCLTGGTCTIFGWSYYISPNELRGFEISIPTTYLQRGSGGFATRGPLVVDEVTQRQMIKIIVMKEKPNKPARATAKPAPGPMRFGLQY